MTTVAWRNGVLCADKQASDDGTASTVTKLYRTKTHAIAFAGILGIGVSFVKWWKSDREETCPLEWCVDDENHCDILVMDLKTGACESWEFPGVGVPIEDAFVAIGSGKDFAIGAMGFGATAVEAVKFACQWDSASGLGINSARKRK